MKSEHDIQNEIRLKLSEMGYFTERINVGSGYLVSKALMDRIKTKVPSLKSELDRIPYFSTGAAKGRSDLSAIKDGTISFIEVKTEAGAISDEQLNFIEQMKSRYGCKAGVARSVEDAIRICEGDHFEKD